MTQGDVIQIVEREIRAHDMEAERTACFSKHHKDMAQALRAVLTEYKRNHEGFREHNIRPSHSGRKEGRRR